MGYTTSTFYLKVTELIDNFFCPLIDPGTERQPPYGFNVPLSIGRFFVIDKIARASVPKPGIAEVGAIRSTERTQATKKEVLEDIIVSRAAAKDLISALGTPSEIAKYRAEVLNNRKIRHRFVFQKWPRSPDGNLMEPQHATSDTMAPAGLHMWGASLFDFYSAWEIPKTLGTGKAAVTTRRNLAVGIRPDEEKLFLARGCVNDGTEEDASQPKRVYPFSIEQLILDAESMPFASNKSWAGENESERGREKQKWELPEPWPPASPFDPIAYPKPWPKEPFSTDTLYSEMRHVPTLQDYIPQSWLPPKLIVHDPWKVLNVTGCDIENQEDVSWNQKQDVAHVYQLQISGRFSERRLQDEQELEDKEAKRRKTLENFLANPHSETPCPPGYVVHQDSERALLGFVEPPTFVVLPFSNNRERPKEAHLYIHPSRKIGEGHHSYVYNVELELPRNQLVDGAVCQTCVMEDMKRIIKEEDGPNNERRDPKWDEKSGRFVVTTAPPPGGSNQMIYEGPYRVVKSRVGFQDLSKASYCGHKARLDSAIHPLTAKVAVAAKLSKQGDPQLAQEAENYQAFPKHFFEHWSGFNIFPTIKDPVPIGPIAPQFYGYYVPEDSLTQRPYLSPILLVEKCGVPINPEKLSVDDVSECRSLIHRFAEAGWFHGSFATRNILRQPGPLSDSLVQRVTNARGRGGMGEHWSFRLIDFGRSYRLDTRPMTEEDMKQSLLLERNIVTNMVENWIE